MTRTPNLLMLPGLESEANVARTRLFDDITEQLAFATTVRAVMVVAGDTGTGKRLAVRTCLQEQAMPVHDVTLPPGATSKDMTRLLYEAVHAEDEVFALRDMQDELVQTLSGPPRIILVDRADLLTAQASEQLHYLHARPGATWTLVLLGNPKTLRAISTSAGLRGEVVAAVEATKLKGKELITALHAMHPMFLIHNEQLLLQIDAQFCESSLKTWARFLQIGLYLQRLETERGGYPRSLDVAFARDILARMPKAQPLRKR